MRRCVCPGSYDPLTMGHLDVIDRARALFDEVVVAIMHNPDKQGMFTIDERTAMLGSAVGQRDGVRVVAFGSRLLVQVCREVGADAIVKGLRGGGDMAYELSMALMNRHLTGIETLFVPGDPALAHVSSSLVKQINAYGGDVTGLVPDAVREALVARRG